MKNFNLLIIFIVISALSVQAQTFEEISSTGFPDVSNPILAWGDVDNDGDLDLFLSGENTDYDIVGGLFINDNGVFTLSTTAALPALSIGAAMWGDFDNDDNLDFLIGGYDVSGVGISDVYQNNGDGTFTALDLGLSPFFMGDVAFVDFNNDDNLDIAITGMETDTWGFITTIYQNNGDGTITDIVAGLPGMNYGEMKWIDYDNDGFQDFVLAGYYDSAGEFYTKIFKNNGDGTFTETAISLYQCWLSDVAWGDFNGDTYADLLVSGTGGDGTERKTILYKNQGDGTFEEVDIVFPGVSHGSIEWADFDGDNNLDFFITGSRTTPGEGNYISSIYINNGDETFTVNSDLTLESAYYGNAAAADYNADGKTDLVVAGINGGEVLNTSLYQNTTPATISFIEKNISISPIPAKNFIKIESVETINKVEIINISGKLIISENVNAKNITLSVENLNTGLYFVKIYKTSGELTKKIIVE